MTEPQRALITPATHLQKSSESLWKFLKSLKRNKTHTFWVIYCTLSNNEDASLTEHLLCWSERTLGHCQDNEKLPWITSNLTEIDLESVEPAGSWVSVAVIASLLRDMATSSRSLQFSSGYVNEAYDNWKIWKLASEMLAFASCMRFCNTMNFVFL